MKRSRTPLLLTPQEHHNILFYSPTLEKLIIPFEPDGLRRQPVQPSESLGQVDPQLTQFFDDFHQLGL